MTQLIQNGSFSQPVIANNGAEYITGGDRVPYWYCTSETILMNNSLEWRFTMPYPNGNQCVALRLGGSISQIVSLVANKYYTISFFSCGRNEFEASQVDVQLYATNDQFIQNIYQYTPPVGVWTSYTATFSVQTSGSYKISFSVTTQSIMITSAVQNIQLSARTAQDVINQYPPWGAYSAANYSNGILRDLTGNRRNAICSGVTAGSGSGNGASANIPYLSGTTTSTIEWPSGSIPQLFTLCSITRYAGSQHQRILQGKSNNFLHGHWRASRGQAFYNTGFNSGGYGGGIAGNVLDWLVFCGKNAGNPPNNILANNQPIGILGGGNGNNTLTINISGEYNEKSDWDFTYLLIWEGTLSDTDMTIISSALTDYLATGDTPFTFQVEPTIGPLVIIPKSVGSSPFFVDNPESNSDGSFTYTSSNESVATVENDQLNHGVIITIIGSGETIITATQAETSVYSEGSVHTTFQVKPNAPDDPVLIENGSELIYSMSIPNANYLRLANNVTITEDILAQGSKLLTSNGMYTINRDF
jgi:hypothetical protein